jgi:hypothetical protein
MNIACPSGVTGNNIHPAQKYQRGTEGLSSKYFANKTVIFSLRKHFHAE